MNSTLYDILQLNDDWDMYGAEAFKEDHVIFVDNIVSQLSPTPFIAPCADKSIQLEYDDVSDRYHLEINIYEDKTTRFMIKDNLEYDYPDIDNSDPEYEEKILKFINNFLDLMKIENYFEEER